MSVDNVRHFNTSNPSSTPEEILIVPFLMPDEALFVDREGEDLVEFKTDLQSHFSNALAERISKHIAPARIITDQKEAPKGNYLLVSGKFITVRQGSRLLRSTVGLGAGRSKMETLVSVYDLSGDNLEPILRFETTGGSNISQGIGGVVMAPITGPMALTSLFNVIEAVKSGVTFDASRTSREITAALSEHLHKKGVLKNKKRLTPKRLGQVPYLTP